MPGQSPQGRRTHGRASEPRLNVRVNRQGQPVWLAVWRDSQRQSVNRTVGLARLLRLPARANPFIEGSEGREVSATERKSERWRQDWQPTRKRMPGTLDVAQAYDVAAELVAEREQEIEQARALEAEGQAALARVPTFGEVAFDWLAEREQDAADGHLKLSTLRDYRSMLRRQDDPLQRRGRGRTAHVMRAFGERQVDAIGADDIQAFERKLRSAGLSPRTRTKYLTVVSMIFDRAARDGQIGANPAEVSRQSQPKRRSRRKHAELVVYDAATVEQIAANAGGQIGELVRLAALTGLRQGELLALTWGDVSYTRRTISVRRTFGAGVGTDAPKSGNARSVPMSDAAGAALDRLSRREDWTRSGDLVFGRREGNPRRKVPYTWGHLSDSYVRREYVKARDAVIAERLAKTGEVVPAIRFHDLRHTFGSSCAAAGIPLSTLQQWMGHADIATTMIYVHHAPAHDDADRLSRAQAIGTPAEVEQPAAAR